MSSASQAPLLLFYRHEATDTSGRTLDQIRSWPTELLESVHDYIQWLFPLRERSLFNPHAPVLDDPQIEAFRSDERLRGELRKSFETMLSFYGLELSNEHGRKWIREGPLFSERSRVWLTQGNHNFLRITRILTSLRTLGLEELGKTFFDFLDRLYAEHSQIIGRVTYSYWKQAVGDGIHDRRSSTSGHHGH
jgi:hypothetical protein